MFERSMIARFAGFSAARWMSKALVLIVLCSGASSLAATIPAQAVEAKRILMLHSFGPLFKPWSDYGRAIRREVAHQAPWPIDFSDFSLVDARSSDQRSEASLVKYFQELYESQPLDLIIAIGAPAASFIQRHRSELFPTTPMIFTAVGERRVDHSLLSENDTVVAVKHDFAAAFQTILDVLPETTTIAIVNGASPNEKFWHGEIEREVASFKDRLTLRWYDHLSFAEILKDAAKLPPHSAIFWHLMNVDATGIAYEEMESLHTLASVASAPIFSYDDSFFGGAIVGGLMFSVAESSAVTAKVANRILAGEKAGDIKTEPIRFAAPRFDWRQMQKWGIDESALPPGSTIYFRPPSFWDVYHWYVILVIATIFLQGGLISALVWERQRRSHAESEARQRMTELAHVNRYHTAGELTATIAHEINQPLGSILVNTESADLILAQPSPNLDELKEILQDIRRDDQRATAVIKRLRSLLKNAPFDARTIDLNESVREAIGLLLPIAKNLKIEIVTDLSAAPLYVNADTIQMQQVVINLVLNSFDAISEQSAANGKVVVSTTRNGKTAIVSVSDTAMGVPVDNPDLVFEPFFSTKKDGMGMGLPIVRTIVTAHGGRVSVKNGQEGAIFRIHLPLVEKKSFIAHLSGSSPSKSFQSAR
jgi:signal transduction histidine kinase